MKILKPIDRKQLYKMSKMKMPCVFDLTSYPENIIPEVIFSYNENLTSVLAGPRTQIIANEAFSFTSNLEFFDSQVTTVGKSAFECSSIKKFNFNDVLFIDECGFKQSGLESVYLPKLQEIRKETFSNCFQLKEVKMKKVKSIDDEAFSSSMFNSIIFPNTLESLGKNIFQYNNFLKDILFLGDKPPKVTKSTFDKCCLDNIYVISNLISYQKAFPKSLQNKIKQIDLEKIQIFLT